MNKQAESAATVRREFLRTTLLARPTPPKTAAAYIAATRDPGLISAYKTAESPGDLLGFKAYYPRVRVPHGRRPMASQATQSRPLPQFPDEQGYTLAAVEEIITGQLTFDEVAID